MRITLHQLLVRKVEEVRKGVTVGQSSRLVAQLVEERMHYGFKRLQTALRVVDEEVRDEVDGFSGSFRAEDLAPSLLSYGRELKLRVAGVHAVDLVLGWCSQHFDDLDELVNARLTREERLADEKLSDNATDRPHINSRGIVSGAEYQFWSAIVTRADVAHIDLTPDQAFGRTEITDLQCVALWVHQQVLRLDIAVTIAKRMDVGKGSE